MDIETTVETYVEYNPGVTLFQITKFIMGRAAGWEEAYNVIAPVLTKLYKKGVIDTVEDGVNDMTAAKWKLYTDYQYSSE